MYTRITVIPSDRAIVVDGQYLSLATGAPAGMHALQWHNGSGHVEYADGRANTPLTAADYEDKVAPFARLWELEKARLKARSDRPPSLEEARLAKIVEINAGYESAIRYIQGGYPLEEVLTWERQAAQARELLADPAAEAAFVRTLAAVKNISVEEMAGRILANAASWEPVAALLTAQRQALEERAFAAQSLEDIAAVQAGYSV